MALQYCTTLILPLLNSAMLIRACEKNENLICFDLSKRIGKESEEKRKQRYTAMINQGNQSQQHDQTVSESQDLLPGAD